MKHTKVKLKAKCQCGKKMYYVRGQWYCDTRIVILPLEEIKRKTRRRTIRR